MCPILPPPAGDSLPGSPDLEADGRRARRGEATPGSDGPDPWVIGGAACGRAPQATPGI